MSKLTDDQLTELADNLRGTSANVYRVASRVLGFDVTDDVFDHLRDRARLVKCIECNVWQDAGRMVGGTEVCEECDAEMYAEDDS